MTDNEKLKLIKRISHVAQAYAMDNVVERAGRATMALDAIDEIIEFQGENDED